MSEHRLPPLSRERYIVLTMCALHNSLRKITFYMRFTTTGRLKC